MLTFWKMTAAGNDFILVDARAGLPAGTAALAAALCPRAVSVGADGLLAVVAAVPGRVEIDYRNADGSAAEFCGNGARCAARYAVERGIAGSPLELVFPGHAVRARVDGGSVEIEGPRPLVDLAAIEVEAGGRAVRARLVCAGVRHVVLRDPADGGLALRDVRDALDAARPDLAGTYNVTAIGEQAPGRLRVRTLERGSGETLACGSAAWAAAAFVEDPPGSGLELTVIPPAGVPLSVRLLPGAGPALLRGEARIVFRGELAAESLPAAGRP
ncbi:MAG: diaminopimelate epimerase [Acidobacteria bacterium]|nr:diaminopimelate epimerase [Acidobacteriota bacterium]